MCHLQMSAHIDVLYADSSIRSNIAVGRIIFCNGELTF